MYGIGNDFGREINNPYLYNVDAENNQTAETENPLSSRFSQMVQDKREDFYDKLRRGETEPSFRIGAGSYTEREWKKLIESFDKAQEALREEIEEAAKKVEKERKTKEEEIPDEWDIEMLFVDSTTCTYPSSDLEEEDVMYITVYTKDGIYCKKVGESQYEWCIKFEDDSQYQKVMEFLNSLEPAENLRFAANENFWKDFLDDKIDMEGFRNFLDTRVKDGIPDYLDWTEDSARINKEAARYAKYMNQPNWVNMVATSLGI